MSLQSNALHRGIRPSGGILLLLAALALASAPAAAHVVVTRDNKVYEVPSRPEIREGMVFFVLDGVPVSLRAMDVNVGKTNELNALLDSGTSVDEVAQMARALPPAHPEDRRLIVSSELQVKRLRASRPDEPDWRLVRGEVGPHASFGDAPGPRRAPNPERAWPRGERPSFDDAPGRPSTWDESRGRFAEEARRAYEEASRGAGERPRAAPRPSRTGQRLAAIEGELDAERAYLRELTSGEAVVDDLDRAIDESMEKIRRLEAERDEAVESSPPPAREPAPYGYQPPPAWEPTGRFPAGSREAKWEQQLAELRDRLSYYREQQAALPAGTSRDREVLDERIGEIEYKIEKLERRLENAARR